MRARRGRGAMNSFYYGLGLLGILVIIHWYIINDGKGQNDGSLGFLAFKSPQPPAEPDKINPAPRRSFRRQP